MELLREEEIALNNHMKILFISGAGFVAGHYIYNLFIEKLMNACTFEKDEDYPEIVLYHHPFKEINSKGELSNKEIIKKQLLSIYHKFDEFNYIFLCCNTFHLLEVNKIFKNKNINLIEATKNHLNNRLINNNSTLVLCSEESSRNKIFGEHISYISKEGQVLIDNIIGSVIKNKGNNNTVLNFNTFLEEYIRRNQIKYVIIGCTELSTLNIKTKVPLLDTAMLGLNELLRKIKDEGLQ